MSSYFLLDIKELELYWDAVFFYNSKEKLNCLLSGFLFTSGKLTSIFTFFSNFY